MNKLKLYEDDDNIIRSQGRLKYADLPYNTKDPIMLHRDHKLATLIVENCHRFVLHRGEKQTLQNYELGIGSSGEKASLGKRYIRA